MPSPWVNKYILARTKQMWNWHPPRKLAKLAAETTPGMLKCAECKEVFPAKQTQVDHIEPIGVQPPGQTWDSYLDRKFCPVTNLQVLCLSCHKRKTKVDVKKMRGKSV